MRNETKDKVLAVLADIEKGLSVTDACKANELAVGTFYNNRDKVNSKPKAKAKPSAKPKAKQESVKQIISEVDLETKIQEAQAAQVRVLRAENEELKRMLGESLYNQEKLRSVIKARQ